METKTFMWIIHYNTLLFDKNHTTPVSCFDWCATKLDMLHRLLNSSCNLSGKWSHNKYKLHISVQKNTLAIELLLILYTIIFSLRYLETMQINNNESPNFKFEFETFFSFYGILTFLRKFRFSCRWISMHGQKRARDH